MRPFTQLLETPVNPNPVAHLNAVLVIFLVCATAVCSSGCWSGPRGDPSSPSSSVMPEIGTRETIIPAYGLPGAGISRTLHPIPIADGFGGFSVAPNDGSRLFVHLLEPSQEAAETLAKEYLDRRTLDRIRVIHPLRADYTWRQMRAWEVKLNRDPEIVRLSGIVDIRAIPGRNRVVVGVNCEENWQLAWNVLKTLVPSMNIPDKAVTVELLPQRELLSEPLARRRPDNCAGASIDDFTEVTWRGR